MNNTDRRYAIDPLLEPDSRSCCECGGRFIPTDYSIDEIGVERGLVGIMWTCPGCFEDTTTEEDMR